MDDAYNDGRESAMTFLMLLSDNYDGGETAFFNRFNDEEVHVRTPKGGALCFFNGMHELQMLHEGKLIEEGSKYMIRTDIIFEG